MYNPEGGPPPIQVDPATVISFAPLSTSMPNLPPMANGATQPTAVWGGHAAPLPTNTFWMNLASGTGNLIVAPFPYHVQALAGGLNVSKPESITASQTSAYEATNPQIQLGATGGFTSHTLTSWDPVSVTMAFKGGGGTMTTPVVYGSPYVTAIYAGLAPLITAPGGLASVNGTATGGATGSRFVLQVAGGQTWIVYASQSAAVTWGGGSLTFSAPYQGWVRVARSNSDIAPSILDQYAGAVPTGGQLRLSVPAGGTTGVVEISWQTMGTGDLLTMALPHHMDHLAKPTIVPAKFTTIRGQMTGVVGTLWQLQYALSPILRSAPTAIDPTRMAAILTALAADKGFQPGAADSYDFGKSVGKGAELLLIAEALGQTAAANQLRSSIEQVLGPWIMGKGADTLVYDTTWGGIVTGMGISSSSNDYGNGVYNDHHFHYGYLLYAAGAVAKGDPAWAMQYKDYVTNLIRDIANPSDSDPYFPQFRMLDWYDGHSWASGISPFDDGRNQESSSEAFNAWVGLSLWGDAIGDTTLVNLGRVMRAVEAASVQRYYHIRANSDIYPMPFAAKMGVGILWSDKGDFTTWFGGDTAATYAIQMIPMTMACEELIDSGWIQDAWPTLQAALSGDGWGSLIDMTHAIIDPADAWTELTTDTVEVGNSRTNMLYWAATRPQ
jgi:endo-1,3(4)-beta-glucanase